MIQTFDGERILLTPDDKTCKGNNEINRGNLGVVNHFGRKKIELAIIVSNINASLLQI